MLDGAWRRIWGFAAIVLMLGLAAGCGSTGGTRSPDQRASTGAAQAPVQQQAQPSAQAPPPGQALPPGEASVQARAYARRLLASLPLPGGASRTKWPSGEMLKPQLPVYEGDDTDEWQAYSMGASPASVNEFMAEHSPPGMGSDGEGSGVQPGGVVDFESYTPARLPKGMASATLAVAIVPASGGGSILRADAQVVWSPPRSAAEHIQADRYSSVTVVGRSGFGISARTVVKRTFASRAVVSRLAGLLNSLSVPPPGVTSCPGAAATAASPAYSLTFTPDSSRWPVVVVSLNDCGGDAVTVGGHRQPGFDDPGTVIAAVHQLPGIPKARQIPGAPTAGK